MQILGDGPLLGAIVELDLSNAGTVTLSDKAFQNYASLKKLKISNNNFERISGTWFIVGNELEYLDIGHNLINQIEGIDNMSALKRLNLQWNSIEHIETKSFEDTKHLEELHLNGNRIESLNFLVMNGTLLLPSLSVLNLNLNRIKEVIFFLVITFSILKK